MRGSASWQKSWILKHDPWYGRRSLSRHRLPGNSRGRLPAAFLCSCSLEKIEGFGGTVRYMLMICDDESDDRGPLELVRDADHVAWIDYMDRQGISFLDG